MSKCESNIDELIVPELAGIAGTVSSRLSDFRDWRGDASADVSELETAASDLEVCGLTVTAIDFANPCARYSEVSFELGGYVVHGRLIEPSGCARRSELVPLCLMFHDIDRPVRGWHHMTRFAAMGYAVLALDDETIGSSDLQQGITSPAFVERVRWGCALAAESRWRFLLWTSGALPARRLPIRFPAVSRRCRLGFVARCSWAHRSWIP